MDEQEESTTKKKLTIEQTHEIMKYPFYWRGTLTEAAQRGESIKETYEELKSFEEML
jgi:hypothetical protein